jgi:hypothetical protein
MCWRANPPIVRSDDLRVNSFWTVLREFSPRGPNRCRFRHAKGKASQVNVRRSLGELEDELEKRTAERDEALAREAAAAEILQIINTSAGNLAPAVLSLKDAGGPFLFDRVKKLGITVRHVPRRGAQELQDWLWDFDARPLSEAEPQAAEKAAKGKASQVNVRRSLG